jgi:Flp pilus assembly protein TadG
LEFALALTPLLLIVFGFIAMNLTFYTMSVMQNSAQYAAMLLSTGQVNRNANGVFSASNLSSTATPCSPAPGTTTIEHYACTGLPSWASFTVTTREVCTVPANVSISISVDATSAGIVDLYAMFGSTMGMFHGTTLTTNSVAMKQGSCP